MFQFPTFAHCSAVWYIFNVPGCPIRKSTDQFVCADPRSLSQLITSFIASESLGIHRLPLSVFAPKMLQVAYPHPGCILTYLFALRCFLVMFLSSMSMIARMSSEKLFWVKDQSVSRLNLVLTFLTSLKTARLLSLSPGGVVSRLRLQR